jgi:multiple sugar transport system permease protein
MSSVTVSNVAGASIASSPGQRRLADSWQFWGALMVVPYLLVFALFVV